MVEGIIRIDRYDTKLVNGKPVTYAIAGKKTYEMPQCYADMYDTHHLAIKERTMHMPEVYDTISVHYVPLRTD